MLIEMLCNSCGHRFYPEGLVGVSWVCPKCQSSDARVFPDKAPEDYPQDDDEEEEDND